MINEILRDDNGSFNENVEISIEIHDESNSNSIASDHYTNAQGNVTNPLNFAVINARSLYNKAESLVDLFSESDLHLATVSETWLKDNKHTTLSVADLALGENIQLLVKNRRTRGGGVAIAFDDRKMSLKELKIAGNRFEMIGAVGKTIKDTRKILVYSVYFPPKQPAQKTRDMLLLLADSIEKAKLEFDDPYVVIGGDFNHVDITPAIEDFPDISQYPMMPTRGNVALDSAASNFVAHMLDISTTDPLVGDGVRSDHCPLLITSSLPRLHQYKMLTFSTRPYTVEGEEKFGKLLAEKDWMELEGMDANAAAKYLNATLKGFSDACFPVKMHKIKSSDPPWFNRKLKRMIRNRKRLFKRQGRSAAWKEAKARTYAEILCQKKIFIEKIKTRTRNAGCSRAYFEAINMFRTKSAPKRWDIRSMFPGKEDIEIAEISATYFNRISCEFESLPRPTWAGESNYPIIEVYEISAQLKKCKKPRSQVDGDVNPNLVSKFHDLFAIPLYYIFNTITTSLTWPSLWKSETVHLIPKTSAPSELSQLRNLSCTPLFSKVLESFILRRLKEEISLSPAQYGGLKGCSVDHFLIDTWQEILSNLEDPDAACSLMSIDFEKAFNRMSHQACIQTLEAKGVSPATTAMVHCFLFERTMSVKIGDSFSCPRKVPGGSPQGSILGNFLFCITTDSLSDTGSVAQESAVSEESELSFHTADGSISQESFVSATSERRSSESSSGDSGDVIPFFRSRRPFLLDSSSEEEMGEREIERIIGPMSNKEISIKCYIDDFNNIEKIRSRDAPCHITVNKKVVHSRAFKSEHLFENITKRAEDIKMRVNQSKTQLLCISGNNDQITNSYIKTNDGRIDSGEELKILGFWFGRTPSAGTHIDKMLSKFRSRLWSLRHLKRNGMSAEDLLFVYKTILRPVLEFAAPTYHSLLTKTQSEKIEALQKRALKIIYGVESSYDEQLKNGIVERLSDRRETLCCNFAKKASLSDRFGNKWFPKRVEDNHNIRRRGPYLEQRARTERMRQSPIFYMRRLLNERNS